MVELDGHVDGFHGVNGIFIGASLGIKAHAVEHHLKIGALFAAQGAAKDALPGNQFLLDQITKSGESSAHSESREIDLLSHWGIELLKRSEEHTSELQS